MVFLKKINDKKFTLISIFLLLYVTLNLLDGERGLISFSEKKKLIKKMEFNKEVLLEKLKFVEKKNDLLTTPIDLDYLETLYRAKFMVGKSNEKIYINK